MASERPDIDRLADTVRGGYDEHKWHHPERELPEGRVCRVCDADVALDELVALARMARASRDDWERQAKGRGVVQYELLARAEAAERGREDADRNWSQAEARLEAAEALLHGPDRLGMMWKRVQETENRLRDSEARVAELDVKLDRLANVESIWELLQDRDRLTARIAELEAERDKWRGRWERTDDERQRQAQRVAELEADLDCVKTEAMQWKMANTEAYERALAAEARVAELQAALDALRWEPGKDCWCDVKSTDYPDMHMPRCKAARAALASPEASRSPEGGAGDGGGA